MDMFDVTSLSSRQSLQRSTARVLDDGTVELGADAMRSLGVEPGDQFEMIHGANGLTLVPGDVPPRKLYVELTTECNLDCAMCIRHSWEEPGGTMTQATFEALLSQMPGLPSLDTVNFSGSGEPLLHPLFYGFVANAKAVGLTVETVTNGLLLDRAVCENAVELKLDRLIVSIDGVDAPSSQLLHSADHGTVRGNLALLRQLKAARRRREPEVTIEFVATRRNIGQLPAVRRLAVELGFASIMVTNVVPHTRELAEQVLYEHWATTPNRNMALPLAPAIELPPMDPEIADALKDLLKSGALVSVNGNRLHGDGPRCRFVTEGRLAVRWDGCVSPCLPLLHSHTCFFRGEPKRMQCVPTTLSAD